MLSTSAVSVLKAMLDEAYERGHRDGLAAARARVVTTPAGSVTISMAAPPTPGPPPAVLTELAHARPTMAVRA